MKLTTITQVSVDGVMQGPGGPEEDERGVFEGGGWAHFDNESGTVMDDIYQRAGAFLFCRRTYEIFAGSWGTWGRSGRQPVSVLDAMYLGFVVVFAHRGSVAARQRPRRRDQPVHLPRGRRPGHSGVP